MGECERMWGSKGSASWKVTVSSRRGVLYPIRVTLSCASLFRFSTPAYVTVTLLFSRPSHRFLTFPTIWPLSSACPPSPFFFSSHENSKFEGKGWIPPNQALSPALAPLAVCPVSSYTSPPPSFSRSTPSPLLPATHIWFSK